MTTLLWIILALIVAGGIVFAASLRTRRALPPLDLPQGENLPKTELQKMAGRTLLVAGLLTIAAAACVVWYGPEAWWEDGSVRHPVTAMMLGGLIAYLYFTIRARSLETRNDGTFDERDGAILSRSCAGVGGAMMVVIAAWMIGLVESYIDTGMIPTYYLYLLFWSCVMTNVIASLAGVLLAYRRG